MQTGSGNQGIDLTTSLNLAQIANPSAKTKKLSYEENKRFS